MARDSVMFSVLLVFVAVASFAPSPPLSESSAVVSPPGAVVVVVEPRHHSNESSEAHVEIEQPQRVATPGFAGRVWQYAYDQTEAIRSKWTSLWKLNDTTAAAAAAVGTSSTFLDGFASSSLMTLLSELGDKTFFVTAILATRHARMSVFWGALIALASMTVLAVGLGYAAHYVPPYIIHYMSISLFVVFGLQMLYEGMTKCREQPDKSDEKDKQIEVSKSWYQSPLAKTFVMTMFAEWGDRSQLTTIVLSASRNIYGVTCGALLAHASCVALAVVVGRALARFIPIAILTFMGGFMFFGFAAYSLATGYHETSVYI